MRPWPLGTLNKMVTSQASILANQALILTDLAAMKSALQSIAKTETSIMSGQDDFNTALTNLSTTVQGIPALVATMVSAKASGDDAAFEAAAQQLNTLSTTITSDLTPAVQQSAPAATAPAATQQATS